MCKKEYYKTVEGILFNLFRVELEVNDVEDEVKLLKKELRGLHIELKDYERDCKSSGGSNSSNSISKTVENKIVRKEKIKEKLIPSKKIEIYNKLLEKEKKEMKINKYKRAINNLTPKQKEIVTKFYIENKKIDDICADVHLEQSQIFTIKKNAIKAISFELWGVDALEEELPLLKNVN